jgi:putative sterol carrier protein
MRSGFRNPQGERESSSVMVEKEKVIETIEIQRKKFTHEKIANSFAKWNKVMQYHFTDTDEFYFVRFVDGITEPVQEGRQDNPDIQYEMSTDTFLAIANKEIPGLKAYQQKLVKLKASMPDMMKLQKVDKL